MIIVKKRQYKVEAIKNVFQFVYKVEWRELPGVMGRNMWGEPDPLPKVLLQLQIWTSKTSRLIRNSIFKEMPFCSNLHPEATKMKRGSLEECSRVRMAYKLEV